MSWKYYPLQFANKATGLSVLAGMQNVDPVDELNTGTPYFVNIALQTAPDSTLMPYVIPFPMSPKRIFLRNSEGAI